MGNEVSAQQIAMDSHFSEDDVKFLYERFRHLDADQSGTLEKEEFMAIDELKQNPLVGAVIDVLDTDKNGGVDFKEFIDALSIFANPLSTGEHREKKLRFAFRLYDHNKDGVISNGDLFHVLKVMVGDNLDETQLQQLVDRTILQGDRDKDGVLSYAEFCAMIEGTSVEKKLVIDFSAHIDDEFDSSDEEDSPNRMMA
ncbi:MAG: hypothetical protein MHM6MM_005202 [Cercozoa sp. M6MM]